MRYFRQVEQNTIGIQRVDMYNKDVGTMSFRSRDFNLKYSAKLATSKFGVQVAKDNQIYRIQLKKRGGDASDFISGVPLFVNGEGRILKRAEIQQLLGMSS